MKIPHLRGIFVIKRVRGATRDMERKLPRIAKLQRPADLGGPVFISPGRIFYPRSLGMPTALPAVSSL